MSYPELMKSHLRDVALEGAVLFQKRKLLWLMGWGQDREGVWSDVLNLWEAIGESRERLMGLEVNGHIVLTVTPAGPTQQHQSLMVWAGERERERARARAA